MKTATKDKSLQLLETELDLIFSRFIAFRDFKNGWTCFICGCKIHSKGNGETGHFIRRQHMPTRYSKTNCNFICFDCNRLQKFMRFELQEMIDHYRIEVEKLRREKGL